MLAPFPDRYAIDCKLWRRPMKDRRLHGFFQRVLQGTFALSIFPAGSLSSWGSDGGRGKACGVR